MLAGLLGAAGAALPFSPASAETVILGHGEVDGGGLMPPGSIDGWVSNMMVNESQTYTNESEGPERVSVTGFNFYVGNVRNRVTPFVVRVNGDNDFVVVAVGTTRVANEDYAETGIQALPFNDGGAEFQLDPGEAIAPGIIDANADGSESGAGGGVIPFANAGDTDELWYTGGGAAENAGAVVIDEPPTAGANTLLDLVRDYQYNIEFEIISAVDTDNDGMPDDYEEANGLNKDLDDAGEDPDGDGSPNLEEFTRGTDPQVADSDGDGLADGVETGTGVFVDASDTGTDPLDPDTDGDDNDDGLEVAAGSDPLDPTSKPDSDGDGMPDSYEVANGLNKDLDDAAEDLDGDGSPNLAEFTRGTDPRNTDTDGDGLRDGAETGTWVFASADDTGTDPLDPDTDKDGLRDGAETNTGVFVDPGDAGSDPHNVDTDGDTYEDGFEVGFGTDPNRPGSNPGTEPADIGAASVEPHDQVDGWSSNLIIREDNVHTNDTALAQRVAATTFTFTVGNVRSQVTPFVVRLNDLNGNRVLTDDNDFTIVAIGATRAAGVDYTETGVHTVPFGDTVTLFEIEPGETVAAGYIDAGPDGTGGEAGSVIPFSGTITAGDMWYNGQSGTPHPSPPTPLEVGTNFGGPPAANVENRDYQFQIHLEVAPAVTVDALVFSALAYPAGGIETLVLSSAAAGSSAGTLTAFGRGDPTPATFTLVAGEGDADNAAYTIGGEGGDRLLVAGDLAGLDGVEHSVRVRAEAEGGVSLEQAFTFTIGLDADGDGLLDAWEIGVAGDLDRLSGTGDTDGDGLDDDAEFTHGTDPLEVDSDGDSLPDGAEVAAGTDPLNRDTDGDGLQDDVETGDGVFVDAGQTGSDPLRADTDGDGIGDGDEVSEANGFSTDPNRADTDGDGFKDPVELENGSDPTDPASVPDVFPVALVDANSAGESWLTAGDWDNLEPPSSAGEYTVGAGLTLRSPPGGNPVFEGLNLTLRGAGSNLTLDHDGTATVPDLRLDGGAITHGRRGTTLGLAGALRLDADASIALAGGGGSTLQLDSALSGTGRLTVTGDPGDTLALSAEARGFTGTWEVRGATLRAVAPGALDGASALHLVDGRFEAGAPVDSPGTFVLQGDTTTFDLASPVRFGAFQIIDSAGSTIDFIPGLLEEGSYTAAELNSIIGAAISIFSGEESLTIAGEPDPNADSDGDGVSDGDELAAGTDPLDAGDTFAIRQSPAFTPAVPGGAPATFALTFPARPGVTYRIEFKAELTDPDWTAIAEGVTEGTFVDDDGARLGGPNGYYRIVVTAPAGGK